MQINEQYRTILGPQQSLEMNSTTNNIGYQSGRQQRYESFQKKDKNKNTIILIYSF